MNISAFVDRFVPGSIKESPNPHIRVRARVLAGLYISCFVIGFAMLALFGTLTLITDRNVTNGLIASVVVTFIIMMQLYLFYKAANVPISAIIFSMTFFGSTFGAVIVSGGWHSPVLLLFFCSPVVSFLVGGRGEGFYMTCLMLVCGVSLMISHHLNFQALQIIQEENMEIARLFIWIISVNLLASCLAVYDTLLESYNRHR